MTVGLRTRVTEVTMDAVQQLAIRLYAMRGEVVAKLITPAGLADPYPLYDQLRAEAGGISQSDRFGAWLLTSHALVSAAVRDTRLTVDNRVIDEYVVDETAAFHDYEMMLRMDPPGHTRIRRLVGKAFTPKAIAAMRPRVDEISDDIIAGLGGGRFDLVGDYAVPLTVRVICDVLGVPADQWRQFREWGDLATKTMGLNVSRQDRRMSAEAAEELAAYLRDHIARKRTEPGDDLLSVMIAAEEEGDRLSDRELLANAFLLLLAGFETTVNLIGNGTVALLSNGNGEQWEKLVADPTLMTNAIEELLRYDSPVQFTGRNAPEDVHIEGHTIPKGKQVMVLIGAANNDPTVFDDPRRLDITRANAKDHTAFSSGAHYCLGASLARLEADVAFSALTREFPGLRLAETPTRRPTDLLRGFEKVPVTVA